LNIIINHILDNDEINKKKLREELSWSPWLWLEK
jgi:hypothetical protein